MRKTIRLLVPGITLFGVLLFASVAIRCLPVLLFFAILFYATGLFPIVGILTLGTISIVYWRRHWVSGLSVLCAASLVFVLGYFPHPVTSPVGWAANGLQVLYYRSDLQQSYLQAQKRGQRFPVGQVYIDGFGSLTSGLAYDPSREIALPPGQRSQAWTDGAGQTELGNEGFEAHHIWGAYYQWYHP